MAVQCCEVQISAVVTPCSSLLYVQGVFFNWYPPKNSKYKKVNLG